MTANQAMVDPSLMTALDEIAVELTDPAMDRQMELEAEMVEDGRSKFWDRMERARPGFDTEGRKRDGEESRTPAAQCLMRRALNPMKEGIDAWIAAADTGKPGRRHAALKHLQMVDPETASFLALKSCLDAFSLNLTEGVLCGRIGRLIEDEVRIRQFEQNAPGLLHAIRSRFETSNFKHHRRVLNALAKRHNVDLGVPWGDTDAIHVGAVLLTQVIERTGLFEVVFFQRGPAERHSSVQPTAATIAWVNERDGVSQFLLPTYMPMVVPPKPWTSPTGGGYRFGLARRLRLVKSRSRGYQAELREWDMPLVYRAVNALQATPWQVNTDVLRHLAPAARNGLGLGGLPTTRTEEIPPSPDVPVNKEDRTEAQAATLNTWKAAARDVHVENVQRRSKRMIVANTLSIAERYADEPTIYFPYTLDFRGRAYPVPSFLQPQGCDYQKALLRFSVGKPLGEQGAAWLAIHGANLMADCPTTGQKLDKGQLQERVDWVFANEDRIVAAAADPDASDFWLKAGGGDSCWQFLAFCFEWAGYVREGESFESHIPVALDGSCNGLQHFSAMLRDEVGGSAVNLVAHDRPADIYLEVRDATLEQIKLDALQPLIPTPDEPTDKAESKKESKAIKAQRAANADTRAAIAWLDANQLDRDLCKQPVMTMPYGSKQFGIREQLARKIAKRGHEFIDPATGEVSPGWNECGYLSKVIWGSLGEVVVKAREAMDWLQACARLAAAEQQPINWVTPDGFWVQQDYRERHVRQIKTQVAGVLFWPTLSEETEKADKMRQQNGVAPNFVHSMDGTAMRACINMSLDNDITHFAMIHDSYATHAADTERFYDCIRGSFIAMYEQEDVLANFRANLEAQLSEESSAQIPAQPTPGTLDLQGIARSDFFFA